MAGAGAGATVPTYAANLTRFNPVIGGLAGAGALDEDHWPINRDSPIPKSLLFISWQKPAAPADFSAPAHQVQGVVLSPLNFGVGDLPALSGNAVIDNDFDRVRCSAFMHAWANDGIFEKQYTTREEFVVSVQKSTTLAAADRALTATCIAATQSFDPPGAGTGPPALKFLQVVQWGPMLRAGLEAFPEQPGELLAQLFMLLGTKSRRNARADEFSDVRISAEFLTEYVRKWARLSATCSDGGGAPQKLL